MGIDISELERMEAICFLMWIQSLKDLPKNPDGTMMDVFQLYDWYTTVDQKQFWDKYRKDVPKSRTLYL